MTTNQKSELSRDQLKIQAKQEALKAWHGNELAAAVFSLSRAEYCLTWIRNVYGETFDLENEL